MNAVIETLVKLQAIEFGEVTGKAAEAEAAELRAKVPAPIIGHYDRLRARGKKGVAIVRNQVCLGCHMRQPVGKIAVLLRGEDIQLCDSCGRYMFLEEQTASAALAEAAPAAPAKPAKTPRKRKSKELATTS
jgi:uncharacterized protein